jgi:hypothetical protein
LRTLHLHFLTPAPILYLYSLLSIAAVIGTQVAFLAPGRLLDGAGLTYEVSCFKHSPVLYTWLLVQVAGFYLLVALGLSQFGSILCRKDEKKPRKNVQLEIDNDDKNEPLLTKEDS